MPPVAGIATQVLAPSVGSLIGSIAGDIAQKALGGAGGLGGPTNPLQLLGNISTAFENLFGQPAPTRPHLCPPRPLPFSPVPGFPLNNPFGALRPAFQDIQNIGPTMDQVLSILQGRSPSVGTRPSAPSGQSQFGDFSRVDSLMDQAKALMNKENPSQADMMRAQELMSQASILGTTFTNLMSKFFEVLGKIAGNIGR